MTATAVALSEIATIGELAALCSVSAPSADSVAEAVESNALQEVVGAGLVPYVARSGTTTDELKSQIADLDGDLHHLADALGVMWSSVLDRAEVYTVRNGAGCSPWTVQRPSSAGVCWWVGAVSLPENHCF